MKISKKILWKSVLYSVVLMAIILVLLHFFPSKGHGPLSWAEIFGYWPLWVVWLPLVVVYTYIKFGDDWGDKDKEE